MAELTENDSTRYARQIIIPGWGDEGQKKIKNLKIGVIGSGGLGSPLLTYLAVGGVGEIVAADKDSIELSNLNRQVLHWDADVGRKKAESAQEKLRKINPDIKVTIHAVEITEENIGELFEGVDGVVDCLDNMDSRFVLNRFAVEKKIPLFHAAVWGFEGRATTVVPGETACLNCIYEESPPKEVFPVLGAVPGTLATIQATELFKHFTGVGKTLKNRLLIYNGGELSFQELKVKKRDDCPTCGNGSK